MNYATIYSAGASLVFKNCSINSVCIDSKNGGPIKLFEEVTVGNWKLPAGARLNVDPTAFPGFASDHYCAEFDEATEKDNEDYADATIEGNGEHNGEADQTGEQPNRSEQHNGSSNTTESDNGRKIELPAVDF